MNLTSASLIWVSVGLLLAGCGGGGGDAPVPLTATEVPKTVERAFANAPAETRKAATEIAADISTNPGLAVQGFDEMSRRPDLTPEQRQAMAQAALLAVAELQKAAASGNAQAKEALEARAARK